MIWFDLDNSPHVPLFRPILQELKKRHIDYTVTARDFAQTKELLELWGIQHSMVGKHGGKNKAAKVFNLLGRSFQLRKVIRTLKPSLAMSHGSRTQLVAARLLGIPSVAMLDYEFTESRIFNTLATHLLMPALIPDERLVQAGFNLKKVKRYPGFKEEIYLSDFQPQQGFRKLLGIGEEKILAVVRPPSVVGNYHDPLSEELFAETLKVLSSHQNVYCLVVNRTTSELGIIPPQLRNRPNLSLLVRAVDGLQLIWHSDMVISGGGTMNRESALLGVPTYSIFTGKKPYLDEHLAKEGKLHFVESVDQINKIPVVKRAIPQQYIPTNTQLVAKVTDILLSLSSEN